MSKITCINIQKFIDWCSSEEAKHFTEKRLKDATFILGYYVEQMEHK